MPCLGGCNCALQVLFVGGLVDTVCRSAVAVFDSDTMSWTLPVQAADEPRPEDRWGREDN